MRGQVDNDEQIPILSDFDTGTADNVLPEDEEDEPTLKKVFKIINQAERDSQNMDILQVGHPTLTMEQQVAAYQWARENLIQPLKEQLIDTIGQVKLKQRGVINGS
jgi:hypothetical protein